VFDEHLEADPEQDPGNDEEPDDGRGRKRAEGFEGHADEYLIGRPERTSDHQKASQPQEKVRGYPRTEDDRDGMWSVNSHHTRLYVTLSIKDVRPISTDGTLSPGRIENPSMFTGIVEATGEIIAVTDTADGRRLRVSAPFAADLHPGQSVNVSGACLTVEAFGEGWFEVFLAEETIVRTTLGGLDEGDLVNLERALAANGRFDGHIVQGHVDGTTEILDIEQVGEDWTYRFALPDGLERYIVEKGSIALDGISLTVAGIDDPAFAVAIIPTTLEETTLSTKSVGDAVNVEVDILAKYLERLTQS